MKKRLVRSDYDRKLFGVLGGIAEYLNVDSTLIRLIFVFVTIFTGFFPGIFFYIAAVFLMPER